MNRRHQSVLAFMLLFLLAFSCKQEPQETRILIFSKTAGFRHESIPHGIEAIIALGKKHNISIDTTENAKQFNEENLKRYKAVIFLSTTGDVLNQQQQNDFERFIQAGGGFIGIHAATDTEYHWPWYGQLVGAYFDSHPNGPNVRNGEYYVVDKHHPSTDSLPDRFKRDDEFYNFKQISSAIKVLVKLDEKTYEGGTNGDNHPASWYQEFDGGRMFYTAMGHTNETFSEELFLEHLWGGIEYVLGGDEPITLNYALAKTKRVPDENRFTKVVLEDKLEEPVELAILPSGDRVLYIERRGKVKLFDPAAGKSKVIATIPVSTKYKFKDGNQAEAEDGLLGIALDPNFEKNNWVYFYYSPAGDEPKNILARYELRGDSLYEATKKVILEVAVQREQCCHTGGSIAFDANGNLFVSTGDNTSPRSTAYAPIDERSGRSPWDAQKGAANTNDLRGKVLRIHPEADGSYTIPEGNLFPKGTNKTRPEIYTMGARNPYRISVDKKTGYLYWGDVGPDAGKDSVNRGPKAYDEINQARKPGFFGWPYFVGDNQAYYDRDFATGKSGEKFDPAKPINTSPNNTGLIELPPSQKAFIWYPYDLSNEFPLLGTGGRTAMAGPVFYSEDFKKATRAFPDYYDKKLFIYEWMRGWIMAVTMDEEGNYVSMERFMPSHKFSNPMDMEFSTATGDLYILEYGTAWFQGNEDARLVRIEFNGGNRKPVVQVAADKVKGATPLAVNFSSQGTKDHDRDELTFEWKITDPTDNTLTTLKEPNPSFTFDKAGAYNVLLTVTDKKGESGSSTLEILAGNEPPVLSFDITRGNTTFFFPNQSFQYQVTVADKEDGSLQEGKINAEEVAVAIDYLSEGFDKIEIAQGHQAAGEFINGKRLMDNSDCKACHIKDKKSVGPMYLEIAKRYKGNAKAIDVLARKIINGGGGEWGDVNMAAHPQISIADATEIVKYILSLGNDAKPSLPVSGSFTTTIPKGVSDQGVYILRAAYTDKGANGIAASSAEKTMILRSPTVAAGSADYAEKIQRYKLPSPPVELMIGSSKDAYIGYKSIDLTGIDKISFVALAPIAYLNSAGGTIEVRLDSPTGIILGESTFIQPTKGNGEQPNPVFVTVAIASTVGNHDIYYVYKNDKAASGQALFVLTSIQYSYNPKLAPPAAAAK